VARDSWKHLARHLAWVVLPETLARLEQRLPRVDCSGRAAVVVVEARVARVVLAVRAVVAQVAVVARVAAAHTQQVLAGWAAMVGHWYWSFDHAAICRG
jgi:hypothetical protein